MRAAVVADAADDVVIEIHQLGQDGRRRNLGGALAHQIAAGRHVAVEGVVRPLVIVMTTPAVDPGLGGCDVQEAAALQQFGLHGAAHALDLAYGLRMAGAAPEGPDAEENQPDRESGEPGRTVLLAPKLQDRGIAIVGEITSLDVV